MTSDARAYERLHELFDGARALDGEARESFLSERCGENATLREEVDALLAIARSEEGTGRFSEEQIADSRHVLESLADEGAPEWNPEQIADYRVVRRIGAGGMGVVYEALQESPRRRVAIKLLHPMHVTPDRLRRFRREAEVLGKLQHPGIAQIFEAGTYDAGRGPQPFFAMELVDGVDLKTYCEREELSLRERFELVARVCEAVQHAHEQGIIHRDLKPDNVLVDEQGQPKVLDFGIARADSTTVMSTIVTEEGQLVGTLAYMAPEQLETKADGITSKVDVHALGVVAFELLTGRLPHEIADLPPAAAIAKLATSDPPRAGKLDARLRGDAETILGKALETDPERRYPSATALGRDIRRFLDDLPIEARRPSGFYRVRKFAQRNRTLVIGAAATFLALAIGGVVALVLSSELDDQRTIADDNLTRARAGTLSETRKLLAAAQVELEAGRPWRAIDRHRLVSEEDHGWAWRLQERALPWLVNVENPKLNWQFVGEDHIVASDPAADRVLIHSALDRSPPRVILEGAGIEHRLESHQVMRDGLAMIERNAEEFLLVDLWQDTILERFPSTKNAVLSVGGRVIASVSLSGEVVVRIDGELSPVRAEDAHYVKVSLDGGWVCILREVEVEILDLVTGERVVLRPHAPYDKVRVHPLSGNRFAVFEEKSSDWTSKTVRVVEIEDGELVYGEVDLCPEVTSVVRYPDDGRFIVPSLDLHTVLRDTATGESIFLSHWQDESGRLPYNGGNDLWARVSPGGTRFMCRGGSRAPWIVTLDEREAAEDFDPRCATLRAAAGVIAVCVSHDGSLVAALDDHGETVRVWDAVTRELLRALEVSADRDLDTRALLAFSEKDEALYCAGGAKTVSLALTDHTPRAPDEFERHEKWSRRLGSKALALDPARERALAIHGRGELALHDMATERERMRVDLERELTSIACRPDGSLLAVGTPEGRILIVETELLTVQLDFDAHSGAVTSLAWMPDGERLVSGSLDGLVRIWDPRSTKVREDALDEWRALLESPAGSTPLARAARRVTEIRSRADSGADGPR